MYFTNYPFELCGHRLRTSLVKSSRWDDGVDEFLKIKSGLNEQLQTGDIIEVCPGYPLAFNLNDLNTEVVTTIAEIIRHQL